MSIQYFYNFSLKAVDGSDLSGDILTGVRRSFLGGVEKIRDRIMINSDGESCSYDFAIERDKPMRWMVKDASGTVVQESLSADNGKYYICFYSRQALYKRLLFSRMHTLLKAEYFGAGSGLLIYSVEPRKAQNGLCLLYTLRTHPHPLVLYPEPQIADPRVKERLDARFSDCDVLAATNDGVIRFLSDEQTAAFKEMAEQIEAELKNEREESFVGDDTPLLEKINAKDFNVKRNLATSLDISQATAFGVERAAAESPASAAQQPEAVEQEVAEPVAAVPEIAIEERDAAEPNVTETESEVALEQVCETETAQENDAVSEPEVVTKPAAEPVPAAERVITDEPAAEAVQEAVLELEPAADAEPTTEESELAEPEQSGAKPDKLIMADGAVYSYYGELDEAGNRSGYGRTLTDLGKTAYEGGYYLDKRSGTGSYYYKDGSLCYSGEWLENARHGVGVGVSSSDKSIHVGTWKNNKPSGNGVRLTADGDIKFVCKELSDGTTVLTHFMPDDTVVISEYDAEGKKIGEKTVSLKNISE